MFMSDTWDDGERRYTVRMPLISQSNLFRDTHCNGPGYPSYDQVNS
jgi:hypothetical protein